MTQPKFEPIITSLLDTDFYKFTMGQVVFRKFRDVNVKYAFKNRSKVNLSHFVTEKDLRNQLDHVTDLKFDNSELHYLRGTNEYSDRMFTEDYLEFLRNLRLPSYNLRYNKDNFELEFEGPWSTAIYWETFALSIINELYCNELFMLGRPLQQDVNKATGVTNLAKKIAFLHHNKDIVSFTDFGTRRRFSKEWQDYVVKTLKSEFTTNCFRGTSNVYLAMKHGLMPMGTSAHEMFMVLAGLSDQSDDAIRNSHQDFLNLWWDQYGYGLSIALTDTFGSEFFFKDMTSWQAAQWKGLRHDSGNPYVFGENTINFYKSKGVDPKEKMIVFSDGLDIDKIVHLADFFNGKIKTSFGWGTNLTNDLGLGALSLVVKPVAANGVPLVKLSDNLAKAMGDPATVERYKRVFGYTNESTIECRY